MRIAILAVVMLVSCLAQELRVMSYNVRYPSKDDGPDLWEVRKDLLVESIRRSNPDIMGTQELFKIQGDYIVEKLPQYAWFGNSRRGNHEDEHMGVFYRKDVLKLKESGEFWLSDMPGVPGSQSWGTTLPRMVTWGLFEKDGKTFYLLNTHFAHRRQDEEARMKSVAVIAARLRAFPANVPVILTGDFNAPAGGPVFEEMLKSTSLRDTRSEGSQRVGPDGTFHAFTGKPGESRIDWILVSKQWKVLSNEAITFHRDDRYPSDHFPVLATIEPLP